MTPRMRLRASSPSAVSRKAARRVDPVGRFCILRDALSEGVYISDVRISKVRGGEVSVVRLASSKSALDRNRTAMTQAMQRGIMTGVVAASYGDFMFPMWAS